MKTKNYWKIRARFFQNIVNMERLQKLAEQSQNEYNQILKENGLNPSVSYDFDDINEVMTEQEKVRNIREISHGEQNA